MVSIELKLKNYNVEWLSKRNINIMFLFLFQFQYSPNYEFWKFLTLKMFWPFHRHDISEVMFTRSQSREWVELYLQIYYRYKFVAVHLESEFTHLPILSLCLKCCTKTKEENNSKVENFMQHITIKFVAVCVQYVLFYVSV